MKPIPLLAPLATLLPFLLSFSVTAQDAKDDLIKQEWEKLQGTWVLAALEVRGKVVPEDELKGATAKLIIAGRKASIQEGTVTLEVSLTIDPAKSPKQIDIRRTPPGQEAHTALGIYRLEGDTLTICHDPRGQQRPTKFKTQPRSNQMLETLRREKK
jgi:uncharacterized protein (TIGR03067 family)